MGHKARLADFDSILNADKIDIVKLKSLSYSGIPDDGGRRAVCWKLLLEYLPLEKRLWADHLAAKRAHYQTFVDDIIAQSLNLSGSNLSNGFLSEPNNAANSNKSDLFAENKNKTDQLTDNTTETSRRFGQLHHRSVSEVSNINELNRLNIEGKPLIGRSHGSLLETSGSSNCLCSDHPLNSSPDSGWVGFFKDNEILHQIDKDVRRLCPDMNFFQRPTDHPRHLRLSSRVTFTPLAVTTVASVGSLTKQRSTQRVTMQTTSPSLEYEAHWEVLERVLFIYAKLNPGQGYVQGMNEIIGPIYYVLATAHEHAEHAEADTFWLFTALMAEVRDLFIRSLDECESGIGRLMARLMTNLSIHDPGTCARLKHQGIKEQYFAFRWLSLLFSQEFPLPDVIRVWDSILSSRDLHACLLQIATAMIILQRSLLLEGDFASNMKLLQNYPPCDVAHILSKAVELKETTST